MNKTANLILFFILAFVFNIVLFLVFITIIIVLAQLILGPNGDPTIYMITLFLGFLVSIVLTFLIYGWAVKWATRRFDLEKRVPQLFKKKR
jgi:high-affinity Fe2+/Pb2+ permease